VAQVVEIQPDQPNSAVSSHQQCLPIERLPLAYIAFDRENRVLEWNPAAERIFGYTKREALGQNILQLIVPSPPNDHIQEILRRIWTGDLEAHSVNENLTKERHVISCDWINTPVRDTTGRVTRVISIARRVTVHRDVETRFDGESPVRHPSSAVREHAVRLTLRQREVLRLVAEGFRTKEIARRLDLSIKTVEMHRGHTMDALDIHDIPGLVCYAIRIGLITAGD
jgi:PAS domain S-box-containing protein